MRDGANPTRQPCSRHSAGGNAEDAARRAKRNPNPGRPRGCGGRGAPAECDGIPDVRRYTHLSGLSSSVLVDDGSPE